MKIKSFHLIGVGCLAAGAALFGYALGYKPQYESIMGLAAGVLLLMGSLYLAPEWFARLLAQISVVRAILANQPIPDAGKIASEIVKEFRPKPDFNSRVAENKDVAGFSAPPPSADEWNSVVRPVLHQTSQYTAPTYYLNRNLQVIDWNLGFDLIFEPITGELRGKHVNWFIARLGNVDDVYAHARCFPLKVEEQPQVDTETLLYATERYGPIEFEKVATKLHDRFGQQRGWAVTLLIRKLDHWPEFVKDLARRIEDDKFWSLYSVSYDMVLTRYSGYQELLQMVCRSVPETAKRVVDLGAGTGNMSRLLLEGGRTVWAVEKNIAMLDLLRSKDFVVKAGDRLKIVKSSVEHLEMLAAEELFDAVTAVNLLYAVDNVPACLSSLAPLIKPDGLFVLTTTDSDTHLTPLLDDIGEKFKSAPDLPILSPHILRVRELNMKLEAKGLTTRYTRKMYEEWLSQAGFVIESVERVYKDAVLLIRTRKKAQSR
jgi:ubiquinone/menaquinone biosynthesis C-methylase UbiE